MKFQYLPINWKDGMSFSAEHLNAQFSANLERINDAIALNLNAQNYGLLGGDASYKFAESLRGNINNEKVEIALCRAVTQNGSRIEILNQKWEELNVPLSRLQGEKNIDSSKYWFILLVVDPFSRILEGEESEKESPRRKPNNRPTYQLEFVSAHEIALDTLANAIPIAKYESIASKLKKIEHYIPPCMRVNSHEKLLKKYEIFDRHLHEIKDHAKKIIDKISKKRSQERNQLAEDIDDMCRKYLDFFIWNYDDFNFLYRDFPPIRLVAFFAKLARVLDYSMEMAYDKNHVVQYFQTYATTKSYAQFNEIVRNTYQAKYEHFDIAKSLNTIEIFLSTLNEVFLKLKELNYHELAASNVVKNVRTKGHQNIPNQNQHPPTRRTIIIRHSGDEKTLDGDLID